MVEHAAGNRKQTGLCYISYLIFYMSKSGRDREVIPFSAGKFLIVNGFEHLRRKGIVILLYKRTNYQPHLKWGEW